MRPVKLRLKKRRSELFFTRLTSCVWFKIGFIIYRYCKNTVNQLWEQLITTHSQVNCWASTCRRKYSSNKGGGSVKSESENDYVSTFTHRLLYPSDELISKSAPKPNCDCLTKVQSACRWRLFQQAEGKLVFETFLNPDRHKTYVSTCPLFAETFAASVYSHGRAETLDWNVNWGRCWGVNSSRLCCVVFSPLFRSSRMKRCSAEWHLCFLSFSLPASPGLLPTLQLDRSIHAAPPAPSPQPFVKTQGLCVPAWAPFHQTLWEKASASAWGTSVEKWLGFMSLPGSYFIHKELNPTTTTVIRQKFGL